MSLPFKVKMLKRKRTTPAAKKAAKYRKKYKRQSLSELSNNRIHFVRRHVDFFTIVVDPVTGLLQAFNFSLSDVPSSTEFTNLYDQYKICGVHMKFYPKQTMSNSVDAVEKARGSARFLSCIDLNDSTAPATLDQIREYESCEVTSILETHERYIKNPLYLNASGQNTNDWVSTSSPSLNWFGLKIGCEPSGNTGTGTFTYNVEAIYYMCFKNIK